MRERKSQGGRPDRGGATRRTARAPRTFGLPQARLQAFCEDADTAETVARTLAQSRFNTLDCVTRMGGIPTALAAYAEAPSPELILVESVKSSSDMLADLEKLAEVCEAGTKVIVIGHVNDVMLYRELMRRHISDYLIAPIERSPLAQSVTTALRGAPDETLGRVVAFIGAKGGCGSSTLSHNAAWVMAELLRAETVIADFDLAFGTLGLDFNQDARQGLSDALAASHKLDSAMVGNLLSKCSDQLGLLTASYMLDADTEIQSEDAIRLVELLSRHAAFVVLDLPCEWHGWSQKLIEMADDLVLTAEPDLANLRNAKNLIDTIRALRTTEKPPILILNKVGLPRRPEILTKDFAKAVDLKPAMEIPFNAELFGTAANNGLMIGEFAPKSRHFALFRSLAETLSGKAIAPNRSGVIKPLIDRLSRKHAV